MKTFIKKLGGAFFAFLLLTCFSTRLSAQTGSSLNFDGVYDYINLPDYCSSWNLGNDFTVEMWVKPNSVSGTKLILYSGFGCYACPEFVLSIGPESTCGGGGTAGHLVFISNGYEVESDNIVSTSAWTHVAVTYNGSVMRMYINGSVQTSSVVATFTVHNSQYRYIGGDPSTYFGCNYRYMYDGSMDELRMWSRALCASEILNNMSCEIPSNSTGLTANYHFNEGTANGLNSTVYTLLDASSDAITGTLYNFALSSTSSNWVSASPFTSGTSCTLLTLPDIKIFGNGNYIPLNYATPTSTNNTEYGNVYMGSAPTQSFLIQNNASGTLSITSASLSGSSDFSITTAPASSVAGTSSTSIVITFSPSSLGLKTATLTVTSNDCDESPYIISLEGTGVTPAAALNFDGYDDLIALTYTIPLTDFTDEMWFKTTDGNTGLFAATDSPNRYAISSWDRSIFLSSGDLNVYTWNSPTEVITTTGTNFADGNWHHMAHVVSSTEGQKIYVDGILRAQGTLTASAFTNSNVLIGSAVYGGSNFFSGNLDEVRLWNVARTQCEIQTYMNCEIPGSTPGLGANYHFNQGIAGGVNTNETILFDAAGSNNGTLSNFSLNGGASSNWIAPGSVVTGYTTAVAPQATLHVLGNAAYIPNNSMSPLSSNFTNFGTATSNTFVLNNIGTSSLSINSISFTGANAANFSVTTHPANFIGSGGNSNIVIGFTPTAAGSQSAIVKIYSSDCSSPTYSFAITASTTPAAALNFNGIGNFVNTPTLSAFVMTTAATIESWFKTTSTANMEITGVLNIGTNVGLEMQLINSGKFEFNAHMGTWNNYQWSSGPSFNDGQWHHCALVVNGNTAIGYVDGIIAGMMTSTTSLNSGDMALFIGEHPTMVMPFDGNIDEVRVWNIARTQCQIQSYMNCEIPTTAPGLVANYHFNQGLPSGANSAVTTLTDAASGISASLNTFTLNGPGSNWVSPGGVVSDYTIAAAPTASISLTGNSNAIPNNLPAASTSTLNATSFTAAGSASFVITNSNTGTLNIGTPYLTGANISEFSITALPSSTLAGLGTTTFVVTFSPTTGGTKSVTVNIYNNDCNAPVFNFAIQGHAPLASALSFDGLSSGVSGPILTTNIYNLTLQAKVYWFGTTSSSQMIMYNGHSSIRGCGIYNNSGSGAIQILYGGVVFTPFNYTLTPNVWTDLTAVIKNGVIECYADGVLVTNTTVTNANTPNSSLGDLFTIGRNPAGSEFFNGKVDEVRFWDKALTQCEIQTYLHCEIPTSAPNLLANYHFNQGANLLANPTETLLIDASGNSNDLTLSNFLLSGATSNWSSPGAVTNGYTITSPPTASISLSGNSNPISNNLSAGSTSTLNFTSFSSAGTATYIITNSNSGTLNIGTPYLTGPNTSEFSITALPASTLAGLATTSFVVAFTPTSGGLRSATVNINNNDCNIPIFNFALTGTTPLGAALTFDGSNNYIELPSTGLPTGNNDFTVEFWIKPKSAQTGHRWVTWFGTAASSGSMVAIGYDGSNGNKIRIHHYGPDLIATTASVTTNVWTHVAINYKGITNSNDIFINGNYVETLNFGTPLTLPTNPIFEIGTYDATGSFCVNMDLDEFRIWNRALCQQEIQNNMNCEIATTGSSLVANYHFNQGYSGVDNTTITTLTDASGSALTGTLNGFASTGTVSNWTAPGAVTSGSSCSVYLYPNINILGNAVSILSGASTPTLSNFTDFGGVCSNSLVVRTFSIQNTGTGVLTVSSLSMSGTDASLFSIGSLSPASPVAAGGGASFNMTLTPLTSGTKTATITINSNDCDASAYTFVLSGTSNTLPIVSAISSNSVICNTATTSVIGSGADTYTWTGSITATNNVAFSPSTTANYSLAGSNTLTGCTSTNNAVVVITVNALPIAGITTPTATICANTSATLIGSGGGNYTWTPGPLNTTTINPVLSNASTYSLVVQNALTGCTSTNLAVQTINVNQSPTISISVIHPSLCAGNAPTLTASNAATYTWSPGNYTAASISPTLNATTVYTLIGSSNAGCISSNTITQTITVYPLPAVTASASPPIVCSGFTTSLSGGGAVSYSWTGGILNATSFTPAMTANYTVTGTDANACQNTASISITVNVPPTVSTNISSTVICQGSSLTLSGSGASTYSWSGGISDGVSFSPLGNTVYSLTGISAAGCTSTNAAVVSVTVNTLPTVTASANPSVLCLGQTSTLNGAGALSYTWTNGVTNAVAFNPSASAIYTVTGEDINGCQNTASISLVVNNLPVLSIATTNTLICQANNVTLTASGAQTYTWSSNENTAFILITPTINTSYSVSGTDANGCINFTSYTQSVSPCQGSLGAIATVTNITCSDKTDGIIEVVASQSYSNSTLSYIWSTNAHCPPNNCSLLENLAGGTYSVIVKATYTVNNILVKYDSVIINPIVVLNANGPCNLRVFTAISPNGDGVNDTWQIENITEFPKNKVAVFNRWGVKVYEVSGYDNDSKSWPAASEFNKLPSSTYFYVIDPGNGAAPIKGWLELIK